MRVFLVVIDSFGIGAMPDAYKFGDEGSDTYGHVFAATHMALPTLTAWGLNNIDGVAKRFANGAELCCTATQEGACARLSEKTFAKDTTAGHYEISGLVLDEPYKIYKTFPCEVVADLEAATGTRFIGNEAASGTEIIRRLGPEHIRTGYPILYTSQDSVLQIAADVSIVPLKRLYEICEKTRALMTGERAVGRVIARPFRHEGNTFWRTEDRKDYALEPPGEMILDRLTKKGIKVISVGKIFDIFCGRGIAEEYHTGNNEEGLARLEKLAKNLREGFVFANLVDTDMLYGHRNDVVGYARALCRIDESLQKIRCFLREKDILIVTADHGCDPTTPSTDHSREYVPLLICGDRVKPRNLGTIHGFDCIADFIASVYGFGDGCGIYDEIIGRKKQ